MQNVDNIGLKRGYLELFSYNENYEKIYQEEKRELEKILKGMYIKIEHVGSTAIKNIVSKPIIDILVVCKDLDEFIKFIKEKIQSDTYTIKEEMVREDDFLIRKEEGGKVKAFIHVVPVSSKRVKDYILFRDYLNENEEEAKKYEKLKKSLYEKYKNDRRKYTLGKEDYISSVIKKAEQYYKNKEYR